MERALLILGIVLRREPHERSSLLEPILKDLLRILPAMQNGDNLQRFCIRSIDDKVGVHREELHPLVGQILAPVSSARAPSQESDLFPNDRLNAVRGLGVASSLEVDPDLGQIERGFRREDLAPYHSVLAFSFAR